MAEKSTTVFASYKKTFSNITSQQIHTKSHKSKSNFKRSGKGEKEIVQNETKQ